MAIQRRISDDPHASVETARLAAAVHVVGRTQQSMPESDRRVAPDRAAVGTPKSHRIGHGAKRARVDRHAVRIHDPDNAAHRSRSILPDTGDPGVDCYLATISSVERTR